MDIRCRKTTCLYNDRHTCRAKGICVNKSVICGTFEKSDKPVVDVTKHLFEMDPDYAPQRDSKTITIDCNVKNCLFNKSGRCVSNGITLNAIREKPYCVSFLDNN